MLCQNCHERTATVHLTKILNYEKTEMHLCEVCAKNVGSELGIFFEPSFNFQNFIAGLLEGDLNLNQQPETNTETHCHNCGLTFSDFTNSGLLGCGECYHSFQNGLNPLLKKLHGSSHHIGKVPKRTGGKFRVRKEISDLKAELQQSISREDYEKAAFLRDEIRRLETEL
jgi:protein arginine kinase activator